MQLAGQSLAGKSLPAPSLGVEAGSPSPAAFPPFPSSFCSSWDVVEHSGDKEEQGHPHASSPVSVWQRGWVPCQGGQEEPCGPQQPLLSPPHRGSLMAVLRTHVSTLSHSPCCPNSSLRLCPPGQRGLGTGEMGTRPTGQ